MEVNKMLNSNGVSLADIAAVTGNNRNNDGMWGDGAWWIVILLIFGWGNNGWGGFGGNGNGAGYTDSAIQRGFDNQAVISKLDGISNGLCDGFYAMNNSMLTGFNGINTNIMQTGYGIQQAVNADTVANMQNTNALQSQLANCCCETKSGGINMAKGVKTRNIDSFREGLMEYAYGRCSQAQAAKIAGMSVPTFRKYANMHFLGIPFPDTLFKAKEKQ